MVQGSTKVLLPDEVRERIARWARDGYAAYGRHGAFKVCGLLFGNAEGEMVRIADARILMRDYTSAPSFTFSGEEENRINEGFSVLTDRAKRSDLEPVGWFFSHLEAGSEASALEAQLVAKYMKPEKAVVVLAGVDSTGAVVVEKEALRPSAPAPFQFRPPSLMVLAATAAAGVLLFAAGYWIGGKRPSLPVSPEPLALHAKTNGSGLLVDWKVDPTFASDVISARLTMQESPGTATPYVLDLSHGTAIGGTAVVPINGKLGAVLFTVNRKSGPPLESSAGFVNPIWEPPGAPVVEAPAKAEPVKKRPVRKRRRR